ncbi:ATP-sensitive inward rectifier potassium channel 10 [Hydrococcus rivularis NIES-593]|uniref:ATP-sensitive inward rectifier potassium channel 10 n=1 Tax=Hydrococcus rivularis NIES-593 TaxID=1921803 RepID=A0A1U7HRI8_9CYAN|nr:ATP-sensitive inward rectifier potassium channel 10 [Hydrococcus rivularis NIES-593]
MKPRQERNSAKARQRRLPVVKIQIQDGRFQIVGLGAWYSYWRDPYHMMLTIPWWGFIAIVAIAYIVLNALFALLYLAGGDCLEGARPGSFEDAFFFSVHTLASIGYGVIAPKTTYANIIVTLSAITSLLTIAVVTGLAFARFSLPTARVLFSRVAVITPYDGVPTLMFRAANQRRNLILEAQLQVYLMRDEISSEGQFMRRIYDLKLLRHRSPSFALTWAAMHQIDENSPLYGATPDSLFENQTTLVISLSGIDETVAQAIHSRHIYAAQDILWNNRFVDVIRDAPNGDRYIDYNHFHDVVPID